MPLLASSSCAWIHESAVRIDVATGEGCAAGDGCVGEGALSQTLSGESPIAQPPRKCAVMGTSTTSLMPDCGNPFMCFAMSA